MQLQLAEQHRHELDSLRSSLALQYKEDLMKMKMHLSDKYAAETEALKRKHGLELEQLHAQLSEEQSKGRMGRETVSCLCGLYFSLNRLI